MAAPSSAYGSKSFKRVTAPGEVVILAKKLPAYGNNSNLKSLFFLDAFDLFRDINTNEEYFIGRVTSGGDNASYHATGRIGNTMTNNKKLLIDSLNTKGSMQPGGGTYIVGDLANNGFKLTLNFKSAYYVDTLEYGIKWRLKSTQGAWNTLQLGSNIAEANQISLNEQVIDVDPTDMLFIEAPNTYEVVGYIANAEGTKEIQLLDVAVLPIAKSLAYGTTRENAYLTAESTYYLSKRLVEDATLYSNSTATIPVSAGFYMQKTPLENGNYLYYECESSGLIIGVGEHNPNAGRVLYRPAGRGATLSMPNAFEKPPDAVDDA